MSMRSLDDWIIDADAVYGAVIDGEAIGIGARSGSPLHPTRDWVAIHVQPAQRRRGIGAALLECLRTQQPEMPTKVRIPSGQEAGLRFAARHGYSPLVSSADVVVRDLPGAGHLTPGTEPLGVSPDNPEFLDALGELYVASHRWDPCRGFDEGDVRRLLAGQDVIAGTARVVRRDDAVVGVGVAYGGASPNQIEMANFGAVDPDAVDGVEITHALLDSIGRPLLDAGVTITVECDFGPGANTALSQRARRRPRAGRLKSISVPPVAVDASTWEDSRMFRMVG